jgi:hypothetical protein
MVERSQAIDCTVFDKITVVSFVAASIDRGVGLGSPVMESLGRRDKHASGVGIRFILLN